MMREEGLRMRCCKALKEESQESQDEINKIYELLGECGVDKE